MANNIFHYSIRSIHVDEINSAREFSTDPNTEILPSLNNKSHNANNGVNNGHGIINTSPVDIARANSISGFSRSSVMQNTIPSSLPDNFDFNKFDLSAPQPPLPMVRIKVDLIVKSLNINNDT